MNHDVQSSEFIQQIRAHARHLFSPMLINGDLSIDAFSESEDKLFFYVKLLHVTFDDTSIVELFTTAYKEISNHNSNELTISYHSSSIKRMSLSRFGLVELHMVLMVNVGSDLCEIRFTILAHLMHGRNVSDTIAFTPDTLPLTVFGASLQEAEVLKLLNALAPATQEMFMTVGTFLSNIKE